MLKPVEDKSRSQTTDNATVCDEDAKYVLVQTSVGDYRQAVLDIIAEKLGYQFAVYAGDEYFDPSTKTRVVLPHNLRRAKNHFIFGRRALFQTGMLSHCIFADTVILELNPRIISVWIILLVRRFLKRKCVLWGHAWARSGRGAKTEPIRNFMRSLADVILLYTETQKAEMAKRMPNKTLIAAPNALYKAEEMYSESINDLPVNVIYVGRLVSAKKPILLLEAFAQVIGELPRESKLVFVGDGDLRELLEQRSRELGIQARVNMLGHVSEIGRLRELYSHAVCSVSPGYVGLSITQSFAFGVPMIIADREPHAPEIEAAEAGVNAEFFRADSVEDLGSRISALMRDRSIWLSRREQIIEDCKARYSAELMAKRILASMDVIEP